MLPSTGYFKTINCPFYESGSCDRPYCHFKHSKREDGGGSAAMGKVAETQAEGQNQGNKATAPTTSNSEILQQLVSEAVKQVLADQEVTTTEGFSETIVSKVVEGLKPTFTTNTNASIEATSNIIGKHMNIPTPITKPVPCVYNPTPISELKKRHIPVASYMPTRDTRVAVKRKPSPDQPKLWNSIIEESGSSKVTEITYKPTAISNISEQSSTESYVPTFKSDSSSNSYEDSNSNDYITKVKDSYYPKSKKRREEYIPKKIKAPLKNVQCIDDNEFESYESQYTIFDKILSTSNATANELINKEESDDYCLGVEGKFSDDEPMPDSLEDSSLKATIESNAIADATSKDKENVKASDKHRNGTGNKKYSNHHKDLNDGAETNEKIRQEEDKHNTKDGDTKSSHKRQSKESTKESDERKRRSSSKSGDKDNKEHRSSSRSGSSRDKHKHKSSSRDRHHSSSSHIDGKSKSKHSHSNKESSHKHKEHSSSRKEKDSSKRDNHREHHKSNKHEKHKTKSSSEEKTKKHSSDKSSKDYHSKKSSSRKKSSSEKSLSDNERRSASPMESMHSFEDVMMLSSDSEHDVEEECLKIFQEYQVTDQPKVTSVKESSRSEVDEVEETGRKRIAHPSAATSVTRTSGRSQQPKKLPNPQQRMYERWRLMREAAAEKAAEKAGSVAKNQVTATSANPPTNNTQEAIAEPIAPANSNETYVNGRVGEPHLNGRIRIAHVPYAMSLALKKKKVEETSGKSAENKTSESRTSAQTTKGVRVAHVPQVVPQLVRPEPLQVTTQKFPVNVRQYYVNIMHDICVQIYTTSEDAAQRALREEFACHERCKALPVYRNSCMLAAHRLRKEVDQSKVGDSSAPSASGMVSHEAVLAGKSKGSWSVMKTKKATMSFKGPALYNMLMKWIMTEQQLRDNGFPRPHPEGPKGRAKVYVTNSRNQSMLSKVPNERICCRCGQPYMVDKIGMPVQQQNCIFHWGRKFTIRGEGKYSCCQQYGSATGCCDAKNHVWEYTDYENLRGYVQTFPKDVPVDEQGVYALDCEMCYTTQGLELTRVTVINEDCHVIYETLVKPQNPIIDYNTRFSGITEDDMKDVTTSLLDVQATLLTMFSEKTILVGHSLESDFKALRLIHNTVVDTSVMFPHKNGYPQKRALRNLCSEYLRKIIQNDIGGHDSKEDAVSCMELILWKVKDEAKLQ